MTHLRFAIATLLLVATAADAEAARRRAAGRSDASDAPAAWLWRHAHALHSTEFPAPLFDLEPLRAIVGDARVVGLGDGTHGTREFYTTKLRMIDFLIREMDFDVVAFEAPFPLFNRLDAYVQSGDGDPRALLREGHERLRYPFWDVEEMLAVVEWMRSYNASRGHRPPLYIAGADVYDAVGGAQAVVEYLHGADPDAARAAEIEYACVSETFTAPSCRTRAAAVLESLAGRRAELEAVTGPRAFREALQNATIIVQSFSFGERDEKMAVNVEWLRENRGRSGRVIVWAHQEHVGKTATPWIPHVQPMGWHLAAALGSDYVAIGSLTAAGSLLQWQPPPRQTSARSAAEVNAVPAPAAGSYESYFQTRPAVALLIPLAGAVPAWLAGPAPYFAAGTMGSSIPSNDSLPEKLDAVVFIPQTTPTTPLRD